MTNNNISKCEADWGFVPYTDIDTLIKTIAKTAIRKNLVRKNNDFYNFTNREIHCMNHNYKGEEPMMGVMKEWYASILMIVIQSGLSG
jgi:hypothetical protein